MSGGFIHTSHMVVHVVGEEDTQKGRRGNASTIVPVDARRRSCGLFLLADDGGARGGGRGAQAAAGARAPRAIEAELARILAAMATDQPVDGSVHRYDVDVGATAVRAARRAPARHGPRARRRRRRPRIPRARRSDARGGRARAYLAALPARSTGRAVASPGRCKVLRAKARDRRRRRRGRRGRAPVRGGAPSSAAAPLAGSGRGGENTAVGRGQSGDDALLAHLEAAIARRAEAAALAWHRAAFERERARRPDADAAEVSHIAVARLATPMTWRRARPVRAIAADALAAATAALAAATGARSRARADARAVLAENRRRRAAGAATRRRSPPYSRPPPRALHGRRGRRRRGCRAGRGAPEMGARGRREDAAEGAAEGILSGPRGVVRRTFAGRGNAQGGRRAGRGGCGGRGGGRR